MALSGKLMTFSDDEILYGFPEREELDATWLQEQISSGASIADIVRLTGYSPHYISKAMKELCLAPPQKIPTPTSTPEKVPKARSKPRKAAPQQQQKRRREAKASPALRRKRIDVEWLQRQLDSGTPIAEIARQAGYSRFGVYYNINKHGLKIPKREGIDPDWLREQKMLGKTDAEITKEFGLNASSVKYYRKKYGIYSFIIPPKE
jgi:AraC-like DNA-binding protein